MNIAIISGNLTKDPDSRTTNTGKAVCTFTLGVRRKFRDANGNNVSDFLPVVCWQKTAELAKQYLRKGGKCTVIGTIQTRTYDAQDGTKRYVTEIIAESLEFGSKSDAQELPQRSTPDSVNASTATYEDDEELPF